jgi:hypothetical protein
MAASVDSQQVPRRAISAAEVEAGLRSLPSHGWTSGWTGRRDRALLVLAGMAGLSDECIADLTVADVTITDGVATIRTPSGTTTLAHNDDGLLCAPCALARWLHALDMTVVYPSDRVIAAVIGRAAPLTADSPHLCEGTTSVMSGTRSMKVLPRSDRHVSYPAKLPAPGTTTRTRPAQIFSGRIPAQRTPVRAVAGR